MPFPDIDPIIFSIGPFALRWYALAYIAGLMLGWKYMCVLIKQSPYKITVEDIDDFIFWATIGIIVGGRLGYVLFYQPGLYLQNPGEILAVWKGGMSFHGGFMGVVVAGILFARKHNIKPLQFADVVACASPIGLFFGRIANFINGELFGRTTDVSWGVVFPRGGPLARHPSQFYEAALEGLVLFLILFVLSRSEAVRNRSGCLTGVFLAGYGTARIIAEFFRQPDVQIGFLSFGTTMGQWLSLPMVLIGLAFIVRSKPGNTISNA